MNSHIGLNTNSSSEQIDTLMGSKNNTTRNNTDNVIHTLPIIEEPSPNYINKMNNNSNESSNTLNSTNINEIDFSTPSFLDGLSPLMAPASPLVATLGTDFSANTASIGQNAPNMGSNLKINTDFNDVGNSQSLKNETGIKHENTASTDMDDIDEIINPNFNNTAVPNNQHYQNTTDLVPSPRIGSPLMRQNQLVGFDYDHARHMMNPDSFLTQPITDNESATHHLDHGYVDSRTNKNMSNNNGIKSSVKSDLEYRSGPLLTEQLLPFTEDLRTKLLKTKVSNSNNNSNNNGNNKSVDGLSKKQEKKSRPAFVNKLWCMVNDPLTSELISWSEDGESFIVFNQDKFIHQVLPKYFKHCKITSFIRQLNMYGWHKLQDVRSGALMDSNDDQLQFQNDNFKKGKPELLDNIVRQKNSSNQNNSNNNNSNNNNSRNTGLETQEGEDDIEFVLTGTENMNREIGGSSIGGGATSSSAVSVIPKNNNRLFTLDMRVLLNEFEKLKYNQMAIAEDLKRLSKENDMLWKENITARRRHEKQEHALERILQLMSTYFGPNIRKLIQDDTDSNGKEDIATIHDFQNNSGDVDHNVSSSQKFNMNHYNNNNNNNNNNAAHGLRGHTRNQSNNRIKIMNIDDEDNVVELNENSRYTSSNDYSNNNQKKYDSDLHTSNSPTVQSVHSAPSVSSVNEFNSPKANTNLSRNIDHDFLANFTSQKTGPKLLGNVAYSPSQGDSLNSGTDMKSTPNLNSNVLDHLQENIVRQENHINDINSMINKFTASNNINNNAQNNSEGKINMQHDPTVFDNTGFDLQDYLAPTPTIGQEHMSSVDPHVNLNGHLMAENNMPMTMSPGLFSPEGNPVNQQHHYNKDTGTPGLEVNKRSFESFINGDNPESSNPVSSTHGVQVGDDDDEGLEEIINPSQTFKKVKN